MSSERNATVIFRVFAMAWLIGFTGWTVYLCWDGLRWWALLTGAFALIGLAWSLEPFFDKGQSSDKNKSGAQGLAALFNNMDEKGAANFAKLLNEMGGSTNCEKEVESSISPSPATPSAPTGVAPPAAGEATGEVLQQAMAILEEAYLVRQDDDLESRVNSALDQVARGGEPGIRLLLERLFRDLTLQENLVHVHFSGDLAWNEWLKKRAVVEALARARDSRVLPRLTALAKASAWENQFHEILQPALARAVEEIARSAPAAVKRTDSAFLYFACQCCGKQLRVKLELAGKKAKCPQCQKAVPVPAVETSHPPETAAAADSQPPKFAWLVNQLNENGVANFATLMKELGDTGVSELSVGLARMKPDDLKGFIALLNFIKKPSDIHMAVSVVRAFRPPDPMVQERLARFKGSAMIVSGFVLAVYSGWQVQSEGWMTNWTFFQFIPLTFVAILVAFGWIVLGSMMLISGKEFEVDK